MTITDDAKAFVAEHWHAAQTVRGWWAAMSDAGLSFPHWPVGCGGRNASVIEAADVAKVFGLAGVIAAPPGLGTLMGGPVVRDFGSAEQHLRLLPALASGAEGWCQLFSEPGAGSDLAGLRTRADKDGSEWIVNGQKVWTSGANHSRRGMLVARTNWDVPKHRGLTYFIIDLDQPGVDIRPLKQMNHRSHFSEVFLTDARVADADRISEASNGWAVTVATLGYERTGLAAADAPGLVRVSSGELAGHLDRLAFDVVAEHRSADKPDDEGAPGRFPALQARAATYGANATAAVRQALAHSYSDDRVAELSAQRSGAGAPTAFLAKLAWTNGLRRASTLGLASMGPHGMLAGDDAPDAGVASQFALSVPSASIAGGSDEIQRNIIGERVLGLPKDISVDTDVAFRDVRKSG